MNRYTLPALFLAFLAGTYPRQALIVLAGLACAFLVGLLCVLAWIALVMSQDPASKGEASETDNPPPVQK